MKHWTETDFQDWLYHLRDEPDSVAECSECRIEFERLKTGTASSSGGRVAGFA